MREDVSVGGMQAMPNGSGMDEAKGQYGPWMVGSGKRLGQSGTKKSTSFKRTIRSTQNFTPPPLMSDDVGWAATSSNGPLLGPFTGFSSARPTGLI